MLPQPGVRPHRWRRIPLSGGSAAAQGTFDAWQAPSPSACVSAARSRATSPAARNNTMLGSPRLGGWGPLAVRLHAARGAQGNRPATGSTGARLALGESPNNSALCTIALERLRCRPRAPRKPFPVVERLFGLLPSGPPLNDRGWLFTEDGSSGFSSSSKSLHAFGAVAWRGLHRRSHLGQLHPLRRNATHRSSLKRHTARVLRTSRRGPRSASPGVINRPGADNHRCGALRISVSIVPHSSPFRPISPTLLLRNPPPMCYSWARSAKLTDIAQICATLGQLWPRSGQHLPNSGRIWPTLGRAWLEVAKLRSNLASTRPTLPPNFAEIGNKLPSFDQHRPTLGRVRPN